MFFVRPKWEWELVYFHCMKKRISIIPGGWHKPTDKCYKWMIRYFNDLGFEVKMITIDWERHVMSDHVEQFKKQYLQSKADQNYVIGFSFGAMIAFITALELKPDKLFLCSLSPYFKEDLIHLKRKTDIRFLGKRRMEDLKKNSAVKIAKLISAPTIIFCGGKEGSKYPSLLKRCKDASIQIRHAQLVIAENAPHEID